MFLKEVKIRNFRNVMDKDLSLSSFHIIEGKNMSGKTNTLNAIHWAFTGTDMEGHNDNRANLPFGYHDVMRVDLDFGSFKFARECQMVDDTPTMTIYIDGEKAKSVKAGEAMLHAKLGLTDIVLSQPKGFDIVKFLLNPLYFENVAPKDLRMFFYKISSLSFDELASAQIKSIQNMLEKRETKDPYQLAEKIDKEKKVEKKVVDACKIACQYFPSVIEEATKKQEESQKKITKLEAEQALADRWALEVSKMVNAYFEKAMGIKVCLLEEGVGEDVCKDVCYPLLPESNLPFAKGSQAEKTYVGVKFIREFCSKFNVNPLPILVDNMESLDEYTTFHLNELGVQYIGALVK